MIELIAKLIAYQLTNGQGNAYTLVHFEQNMPVYNYYIKYSECQCDSVEGILITLHETPLYSNNSTSSAVTVQLDANYPVLLRYEGEGWCLVSTQINGEKVDGWILSDSVEALVK
ncbi:MAG: hypothetical protein KGZ63_09920 [Clostridiales bacterium]|nr:hypothetical protein [Clostridiales bacterium]